MLQSRPVGRDASQERGYVTGYEPLSDWQPIPPGQRSWSLQAGIGIKFGTVEKRVVHVTWPDLLSFLAANRNFTVTHPGGRICMHWVPYKREPSIIGKLIKAPPGAGLSGLLDVGVEKGLEVAGRAIDLYRNDILAGRRPLWVSITAEVRADTKRRYRESVTLGKIHEGLILGGLHPWGSARRRL
jgi:hypothetical protein